jgi:hypothetical protein
MRRIVRAGVAAILAVFVAGPNGAEAEVVSLVGAWQSCQPIKGCIRFAFMPNGSVIKQYPLLGSTVTAYGRYRRQGDMLQVAWTRVSPKRVCGASVDAKGHKQCVRSAEPNVHGPLQFDGFNALVWKISGAPQLRLDRIEQ